MLSSSLQGLPEDDPLPYPEAANVYYGARRPRSENNDERLTVEVEAAEVSLSLFSEYFLDCGVHKRQSSDPQLTRQLFTRFRGVSSDTKA